MYLLVECVNKKGRGGRREPSHTRVHSLISQPSSHIRRLAVTSPMPSVAPTKNEKMNVVGVCEDFKAADKLHHFHAVHIGP